MDSVSLYQAKHAWIIYWITLKQLYKVHMLHVSKIWKPTETVHDKVVAIWADQFHVVKPCSPAVRIDV